MSLNGAISRTYSRAGSDYPSDSTDSEWNLSGPLVRKRLRRRQPRMTDMRLVTDALLSILETGFQ